MAGTTLYISTDVQIGTCSGSATLSETAAPAATTHPLVLAEHRYIEMEQNETHAKQAKARLLGQLR